MLAEGRGSGQRWGGVGTGKVGVIEAIVKAGSWEVLQSVSGEAPAGSFQNREGLTGQEGRQAGDSWKPSSSRCKEKKVGECNGHSDKTQWAFGQ